MKRIKVIVVLLMLIGQAIFPTISHADTSNDFEIQGGVLTKYTGSGGDVVIPDGVTEIATGAFSSCYKLKSVIFPDSLIYINMVAFINCEGLTSINIPCNVANIGYSAFSNYDTLTAINVDANNPTYASIDGVLFSKDLTRLILFPAGRNGAYSIPNGVVSIETNSFSQCAKLSEIILPEGIISIGNNAFSLCSSLKNITLPNTISDIGTQAFGTSGLTSISISAGVVNIGHAIFEQCFDLTAIYVDKDNPKYASMDGVMFSKDFSTLVAYPGGGLTEYTIPNGVETIGVAAFQGCRNLISVIVSDSVTSIETNAFYTCSNLANVILPEGLQTLGSHVFASCYDLINVRIPNSVTSLGSHAFNSSGLTYISVPSGVINLENYTFSSCEKLKSIFISNKLTNISENTFYKSPNVTIYAPEGSCAQTYAEQNGIPFVAITSSVVDVKVTLNDEYINFDQPPVIVDGRTLVPIRAVCEKLGTDVYWYEAKQGVMIVKNEIKLFLTIGQKIMGMEVAANFDEVLKHIENANDGFLNEITLDVAPQIIGGRTLLSIRAVCEALGASVCWDEGNSTVVITCPQELIDDKNKDTTFLDEMMAYIDEQHPKGTTANAKITLGASVKFTEAVIKQAADAVLTKFPDFIDCELTELWYDEEKSDKEVESYMTSGKGSVNGVKKENVIILFSNFNTGDQSGNDGFNSNSRYTNWNWILIRYDANSSWRVDDWGY